MNLPPNFTISLPGGITELSCDRCGESVKRAVFLAEDTAEMEACAAGHRCNDESAPPAEADGAYDSTRAAEAAS